MCSKFIVVHCLHLLFFDVVLRHLHTSHSFKLLPQQEIRKEKKKDNTLQTLTHERTTHMSTYKYFPNFKCAKAHTVSQEKQNRFEYIVQLLFANCFFFFFQFSLPQQIPVKIISIHLVFSWLQFRNHCSSYIYIYRNFIKTYN